MNGFSDDGYIIDQDYFDEYEYRTMQASINGCGWIAAYNIRHYLGHGVGFEHVMDEMDRMHSLRIPGPTTMPVMRAYLRKYVPAMTEHIGRDEAYKAALSSAALGLTSAFFFAQGSRTLSLISARETPFAFSTSTTGWRTMSPPWRCFLPPMSSRRSMSRFLPFKKQARSLGKHLPHAAEDHPRHGQSGPASLRKVVCGRRREIIWKLSYVNLIISIKLRKKKYVNEIM